MTTDHVDLGGSPFPDGGAHTHSAVTSRRWRVVVGALAWPVLFACVIALFFLFMSVFTTSIGLALHAKTPPSEQVPIFWGLVIVCGVLGLVLVFAVVGQRWVALVVALVIGCVSGVAAGMVFENVSSIITPPVHIKPEPIRCQCYSGSPCDCPGG